MKDVIEILKIVISVLIIDSTITITTVEPTSTPTNLVIMHIGSIMHLSINVYTHHKNQISQ